MIKPPQAKEMFAKIQENKRVKHRDLCFIGHQTGDLRYRIPTHEQTQ